MYGAFVFDSDILDALPRADRRVEFICESLADLDLQLRTLGRSLGVAGAGLIVHGRAVEQIAQLAAQLRVQAVYANHDDEPAALAHDAQVRGLLSAAGRALHQQGPCSDRLRADQPARAEHRHR